MIDLTNFSNSNNPDCCKIRENIRGIIFYLFAATKRLCNAPLINLVNFIFANNANFVCPFVLIAPPPLVARTFDMKHS